MQSFLHKEIQIIETMTEKGGIHALDIDNETLQVEIVNSFSKECWG